ncbi:MAG: phosphopantetheine-binding protein [Bacilli bacterium]|nr:phosphopantetheine-binding protein [Bacilli bacterium]MDD3422638.1 phosphopantetheine-binding protein [Bacilli bacterium]MDD4065857.1 phosphopantetheine-binding protein [Bacilli bacterium]
MEIEKKFIEILRKKIGDKEVKSDTDLRGLGIDSLDLVEIIMESEDVFGVQFSNEELNNFQKVSDVVKAIEAKKA